MLRAVPENLVLDAAAEEVVRRLQRVHRPRLREFRHLLCVEVRDPDVTDLAFVHELLERSGGLGERHLRIGPVHLEEIDVVDPERRQTVVESAAKPGGARIAHQPVVSHPQAALGGDHDLVAVVFDVIPQRVPEHALRGTEAVAVGRVEEVDSQLACLPDRRDPLVLVELPPLPSELPGAEGDRRDLEVGHPEADSCRGACRHRAPSVPSSQP